MQNNIYTKLDNLALIKITGDDSSNFLQRIVSNDINLVSPNKTIYSLLLTPQGKLLYDFFILQYENGYLIECFKTQQNNIIGLLGIYKLRSKVEICDVKDYHSFAFYKTESLFTLLGETKQTNDGYMFSDPRHIKLWNRAILKNNIFASEYSFVSIQEYKNTFKDLAILYSDDDIVAGKSFPHNFNLDRLNAISYSKGCYIGQEVTTRVHSKTMQPPSS